MNHTRLTNESIDYLRPKIKNIKMVCNVLDKVFAKRKNLIKLTENKIYDNLDYLVFKTGVKTLNKRIVTKKQLVENIKSKKTTNKLDTVLSPKVLAYSLSENFNKQFSGLNKEEKELISEIITLKTEDLDKNFIEKAPSNVIKENTDKQKVYQQELIDLKNLLDKLSN